MSDRSFIRPIRIPGKRFVLTKNMIEEAQSHTKSNMAAAKWLNVSYNTYKKWSTYYGLFEENLKAINTYNKRGKGALGPVEGFATNFDDIIPKAY